MFTHAAVISQTLKELGLTETTGGVCGHAWFTHTGGKNIETFDPATGESLAKITTAAKADYDRVVKEATEAHHHWRLVPAPQRGEIIRQFGEALRAHKTTLARLISLETGKIYSEGLGEVQEAIDMCDFAVGLSRQLYGLTIVSERAEHRMMEQWHPLGVVGVITAFNFPMAVWAWNACLAAVCGNSVVWKPSEKTPLCAVALQKIAHEVFAKNGHAGVVGLVNGGRDVGEWLAADGRVALVSATGSVPMGRAVGQVVAARFGKALLELGGNNSITVCADADLELATRAIVFSAVGTAGQRCTSCRRLFVEEAVEFDVVERLTRAYASVKVGDPLQTGVLMGPLIDASAVHAMQQALKQAVDQGGKVITGGDILKMGKGHFVSPAIVLVKDQLPVMHHETFAPILYVMNVKNAAEAIALNNAVPQGLSSALFTRALKTAEKFLSATGSDCGIANVNIGTSGAEIGGAFGGEKETGGGRESGSDSWKAYMRRQTCTINYSDHLPLAQGVEFL